MKSAFRRSYDTALLEGIAEGHREGLECHSQNQRRQIDRIVSGEETGRFWMLLGPKVYPNSDFSYQG